MTEPVSIVATSSIVAAVAAVFLQASGIDLPPVLWAMIGAAFMQGHSDEVTTRLRVAVHIVLSGLLGGLMGTVFAKMLPDLDSVDPRHLTLLAAAVCGFGSQPLMQWLLSKIYKVGGGAP